jgi:uracil-DNA glycosylase
MGFCFPGQDAKGGDLPPRRECAPAWRDRVMEHMPQLKLILVIGQYAHAWHLGDLRQKSLTETVRDWRTIMARSGPGSRGAAVAASLLAQQRLDSEESLVRGGTAAGAQTHRETEVFESS